MQLWVDQNYTGQKKLLQAACVLGDCRIERWNTSSYPRLIPALNWELCLGRRDLSDFFVLTLKIRAWLPFPRGAQHAQVIR